MTKEEAIKAMSEGKKVTHRYFENTEWMTIGADGRILLEDGVRCSVYDFFSHRTEECWNNGYSLYAEGSK